MLVKAVYLDRINLCTATGPVRAEGEGLRTSTLFWPLALLLGCVGNEIVHERK